MNNIDGSELYNTKIKERLAAWLDALRANGFDLNFELLAQKMNEDYGIQTTAQKLRPMFNTTSTREVKLAELAALAHIIQLPIGELCEFPNAPATASLHTPWIYQKKKDIKQHGIRKLDNPHYHGLYHAYYFHPKSTDKLDRKGASPISGSTIDEAEINITVKNGEPYVILKEKSVQMDFYENKVLDHFILEGKLYLIDSHKIAYSFITDAEARRSMALMFRYRDFAKDILYYTTVGMLTFSLNEIHHPMFQKMAMFRVKQNLEDSVCNDIVRGILSLSSEPIRIEQEIFENAVKNDTYFGKKLEELLKNAQVGKPCYEFSESAIRQSSYNWTSEESAEVILKLKEMSEAPAYEIVQEQEYFRSFIKHHQQKQLKKTENSSL